jgi:hypothetical protein
MLWLVCRLDQRKTEFDSQHEQHFVFSPSRPLWSLASLLSSGYRDYWRSVSAGAGSWLLTSDHYFRVLLNRRKEHLTFIVYIGLPFYVFVARIACDEHDVSCVVLFHLCHCSTDFGEVLYWGSAIRSGRIYLWLESVQATPVLYGVGIYLYTLPQTDLHETVVDLSDVKWAIIPIKVHNLGFYTDNGPGGGGGWDWWVRGDAVGWGNAPQAGRSWVRFSVGSLGFFIYLILPDAVWLWGRLIL